MANIEAKSDHPERRAGSLSGFTLRVLILLLLVGIAVFLVKISDLLLIMFGAILFAVILSSASNAMTRYTHIKRNWALLLVVLLIVLGIGGLLYLFGAQTAVQVEDLTTNLPNGIDRLRTTISKYSWAQQAMDQLQKVNIAAAGGNVLSHALGALGSAVSVVTDFILIFFSGLYLALQPDLYLRGVLSLTPPTYRSRMADILAALYDALRQWLFGQLVSMVVVGLAFGIALSLIGVPAPIVLGLIAAISEFVPLVGPVIATIPAVLEAASQSLHDVVWVVIAFLIIQQMESNFLVPVIQRRAVHLPPVLALFATVLFGMLFGIAGLLFATPLVVAAMTVIQMAYVDDILGGPEDENDPKLRALVEQPAVEAKPA